MTGAQFDVVIIGTGAGGGTMARALSVNDHPRFIDALTDAIASTVDRYRTGRPLPIVSAETPNAIELPPPVIS